MAQNEGERLLATAVVELADTLSGDPDLPDLLQTLVDRVASLVDAAAVGLFLDDQRGGLQLCASSTHAVGVHALLGVATSEGPCLEVFRAGQAVLGADLAGQQARWPRFATALSLSGLHPGYVLPVQTRARVVGSMGLFFSTAVELTADERMLVEALTKVATLGFLHETSRRHREIIAGQLQAAMRARVVVEQVKGVLAETLGISVDRAFDLLKEHARRTGAPIGDVASKVLDRAIDPSRLAP